MSTTKLLQIHKLMAGLILVTGLVLMTGKIYFDSEPGLIPIVLVLLGLGWLLVVRGRSRSRRN